MHARLAPALLLLAACTRGDAKSALNAPTIDTLPGGIVRVHNNGPTAWTDTNGWKLVLEHSFTMPEGSPGQLNNPAGIVADSKGNIYTTETYTGKRLQKFTLKGEGAVPKSGVPAWPGM